MCDNVAVRWSEYEREKSQIEAQVRVKISQELEKYVEDLEKKQYPNDYISGMEKARLLVLHAPTINRHEQTEYVQEQLF